MTISQIAKRNKLIKSCTLMSENGRRRPKYVAYSIRLNKSVAYDGNI